MTYHSIFNLILKIKDSLLKSSMNDSLLKSSMVNKMLYHWYLNLLFLAFPFVCTYIDAFVITKDAN